MAVGDMFFNSGTGFNSDSGEKVTQLSSGQLAAFKDGLVYSNGKTLIAYRWVEVKKPDRKGKLVTSRALEPAWTVKDVTGGAELIAIGDQVITPTPCSSHIGNSSFSIRLSSRLYGGCSHTIRA